MFTDFESRPQLDAHGSHQVLCSQQHQRLPVYLLESEVLDIVAAAGEVLDEVADLLHAPLQGVVLGAGKEGCRGGGLLGRGVLLRGDRCRGDGGHLGGGGGLLHRPGLHLLLRGLVPVVGDHSTGVGGVGVVAAVVLAVELALGALVHGARGSAGAPLHWGGGVGRRSGHLGLVLLRLAPHRS